MKALTKILNSNTNETSRNSVISINCRTELYEDFKSDLEALIEQAYKGGV